MSIQNPTTTWHVEHSRNGNGITTLCGHLIPWASNKGKRRAVTGRAATAGRTMCRDCIVILCMSDDIRATEPIEATDLLDEADLIIGGQHA